ncbi:MAG: ArnT family glycosyltransferase [Rhodospirillales bacterium]
MTQNPRITFFAAAVLWAVMLAAGLYFRPLLPVDETRYLAVAWEMRAGGDWLVPHLNGDPYHHKPPLLFWLINLAWSVFGVSEWAARMIAPLSALVVLGGAAGLARALWPERPDAAALAPLTVLGMLFWGVFSTLTMFDMMLSACAVIALWGLAAAWRSGRAAGFFVFGLAIGLGVLTKGPVIVLHTAPVWLLAPLWGPRFDPGAYVTAPLGGWPRWFAYGLIALLGAAAMGFAWAVPAAEAGGPAFAEALLWGQTAGRVVESFAHARPWWFYAAVFPAMLLPGLLWFRIWRGVPRAWANRTDWGGFMFLLCWLVPALIVFSFVSGKNPHYLLPELAAAALAAAWALAVVTEQAPQRWARPFDDTLPIVFLALCGAALAAAPELTFGRETPPWWAALNRDWGLALAALAVLALARMPQTPVGRALMLAGLTAAAAAAVNGAAQPVLAARLDLRPAAEQLGLWQNQGRPIAHVGKYHGQYHFLGRLEAPLTVLAGPGGSDPAAWAAAHPEGYVVTYRRSPLPEGAPQPAGAHPFRSGRVLFWPAADIARNPALAAR